MTTKASDRENSRLAGLAGRLNSVAIRLLRSLRTTDQRAGLSAARLSALSVVVYAGPLSLAALAAAEDVRPPTMSRIVAALERGGLTRRAPDPADGRAIVISATVRGKRVLERARRRRVAALSARLAQLDSASLDVLDSAAAILARLLDHR